MGDSGPGGPVHRRGYTQRNDKKKKCKFDKLGNVQISFYAKGWGVGLLKSPKYRQVGRGGLAKSSYNFYSG